MLSCFSALIIMGFMIGGLVMFLKWTIGEHQAAQRGRALERLAARTPPPPPPVAVPGWNITYKVGKKTETKKFTCDKEEDALVELLKQGVGPRDIVASVKM